MQLRIVIRELQQQQSRPNSVAVGFRNSKLTKIMQNYLTGHSATRIIIAISNDPRFREETSASLEFASTASTISMGRDRRGNRTRSLLNISEVPDQHAEEPTSSDLGRETPDTFGGPQPLAEIPYEHWSKDDLIADLRYYVEQHDIDQGNISRLKNGWKEDEYNYNRDYKEWEKERKNHQIDLWNLRVTKHNEMEEMVYEHLAARRKLREQIKQLQSAGQSTGHDPNQLNDLQESIAKLESDLAAAQLEVSDLKEQNRASESNLENARKELELANLKLNERNDANLKYDEDVRAYKAQIEEKEKLISHLKDSYEDVHDNLTAMQSEKQHLEQKLAQREHDLEHQQEQMLEFKQQLIKTPGFQETLPDLGNSTLEMFQLTPAKANQPSRKKSLIPEHSTFQYPVQGKSKV